MARPIFIRAATRFSAALLLLITWEAADGSAVGLAPHRALYQLSLDSIQPQSDFIDVKGGISVDWTQTCDGWTVEQLYVTEASLRSGEILESEIRYSSFESADSRNFRFTSVTRRNGEVAERFTGGVEREDDVAASTADYAQPAGVALDLPTGTMFPMQHMEALVTEAERGNKKFAAPYFDGPRPEETPFQANALIIGQRQPPEEGAAEEMGPPIDRPWWQVRIAFFPRAGTSPDPDFELAMQLQDNGIARSLVFDYGEIILRGELIAVEAFEIPACP